MGKRKGKTVVRGSVGREFNPVHCDVEINECDGCGHINTNGSHRMIGCNAGVSCWRRINDGYIICKVAANEYRNGHLN